MYNNSTKVCENYVLIRLIMIVELFLGGGNYISK